MGFGTRLRNGLAQLLSSDDDIPRYHNKNSLNINLVRDTMNSSLLSEMVPGLSQPVWGPEISTVGAYSREGYTSRTFDQPTEAFSKQVYYVRRDEDVQLALNHLTSQVTGGEHYWKSEYESVQEMMQQFSTEIGRASCRERV